MKDGSAYEDELAAWRATRLAALKADDGWLNLTDRIEIETGNMLVGSADSNDIILSVGPAHLGRLELKPDGTATLTRQGKQREVFLPVPDSPPRLVVGDLLLEIHSVDGSFALRVRDLAAPYRHGFDGLQCFPTDPTWNLRAEWIAFEEPVAHRIGMAHSLSTTVQITHKARFVRDGRHTDLLATHWKSGKPMFVFRDATSGHETYGACRFLMGENADDRHITLDFNKAFNPPCAFTDHAVCPLPPPQNILPFPIRAGELKPR